jgi:hypothetical protein
MSAYRTVAAALGVCLATSGWAAEITAKKADTGDYIDVFLTGEILRGDDETFKTVVGDAKRALVFLEGPGGDELASIAIGEMVRVGKFSTAVGHDTVCASGCAIVWLAGERRLLSRTSRIGLHSAGDKEGKTAGAGSAVVGAYLTRLGFGYDVVAYATAAEPGAMTWLSKEDADRLGITYEMVESDDIPLPFDRNAPSSPPPTKRPPVAEAPKSGTAESVTEAVILHTGAEQLHLRVAPDPRSPDVLPDRVLPANAVLRAVPEKAESGFP